VPPIYLDDNATTPIDPTVVEAMAPFLREGFAIRPARTRNGHVARDAVARARAQVAALLGARADEIVFTGGGSEASNLALKGVAFAALAKSPPRDVHVVTTAVEHPATLQPCAFLERSAAA
jgi:cysteine desulfurase